MGLRLLPFRSYNESDVVNMFALETGLANDSTTDSGQGDNGVFVKVTNGNFNDTTITYAQDTALLGKSDYPFAGSSMYPTNPLTISGAGSGDIPLGVTLNQTAIKDENGESYFITQLKKKSFKLFFQDKVFQLLHAVFSQLVLTD